MNSYAIIMGVTEYDNAPDLPACANDANIMKEMFEATNKYNILTIPSKSNKEDLLNSIESFLPLPQDQRLDEVVFYFSGHGCQDDDDTHFVLKGTSIEKISGTSLNNSELDAIIRKRNPRLFVKIIDACESGLTYIKSQTKGSSFNNLFSKYSGSEKTLENCFFMCSSKCDQSSIATSEYSLFTHEFVLAVVNLLDNIKIRYTDILNVISDSFRAKGIEQTPFFTTQSNGLEIFSESTPDLKKFTEKIKNLSHSQDKIQNEGSSIEQDIDRYLSHYRKIDEIASLIQPAIDEMKNLSFPESWLLKYYVIDPDERGGFNDYIKDTAILKFLNQRYKDEHLYIDLETEKYKEDSILGIPTWKTSPTEFYSTQSSLPTCFCYKLIPQKNGLPTYHIMNLFIYGMTYFYTIQFAKQYIVNGDQGYVVNDKTKLVYKKLEYSDFNIKDWIAFQAVQLEEYKQFIEESVIRFIK